MLIRGEANGSAIEFSEEEGLTRPAGSEFYRVTLRGNGFEGSIRVYAFDPTDEELPRFFDGLARDWKGWEGSRHWSSLEGEFELECRHDGIGHAETVATIHSNRGGHGWSGEIRFDIAAGELDRIAKDVNRFFERTA